MDKIRTLLHRLSPRPPSADKSERQAPDRDLRGSRATHVSAMQANVSRIQQEILELSNAVEVDGAGVSPGRMADLERELNTAQRELARIQGRV